MTTVNVLLIILLLVEELLKYTTINVDTNVNIVVKNLLRITTLYKNITDIPIMLLIMFLMTLQQLKIYLK